MISIDFDTSHIPAGTSSESCIIKCGKIRLSMRGTPKKQNMRFIKDKNSDLKKCVFLKGETVSGVITIEDLNYKNFIVMVRDKDGTDKNTKVFSAKQVMFLPKDFKDWTGTLKK